ncbi:MAG TPA: ATP-binding protein [Telluria sp.]|jgi:hypothetical protein
MTPEFDNWLAANDNYLALALDWLRERLGELARESEPAATATPPAAVPTPPAAPVARARPVLGRLFTTAANPPLKSLPGPAAAEAPAPPASGRAAMPDAMLQAEQADPPPALLVLSGRMDLSRFESMTLLLCCAMELDSRIGPLCARAQGDGAKPFPTFGLALKLFDDPAWDVLSPLRPLRHWRLLEVVQAPGQPLVAAALRADERIVNYIKGLNYLDDGLTPLLTAVPLATDQLPPSQQNVADAVASAVERSAASVSVPVIELLGADGPAKQLIARAAAQRVGLSLYRMRAEQLPANTAELELFIRLWRRESALLPLALLIDASETDRAGAQAAALVRLIERDSGMLLLDVHDPWPQTARESLAFEVARPAPAEQHAAWAAALGERGQPHAPHLSAHFSFNTPVIRQLAATALREVDDGADLGQALWRASLRRARPALDQLAQVIDAKAGWDDLALPETEKTLLHQVVDQVRTRAAVYDDWGFRDRMNRGLGISVLFAGESGTGKTMAAEVIARELGLLIFRIDLSAVVSKYIGETEKNLRRLFDAAEDGGAILFFDEADALFGKRSEVRDSHDRYANIEVNYLLQRIEGFRGLAILASNMKTSLDAAFLRRLRFVVNFPFPGAEQRVAIWKNAFPPKTPLATLDYQRLARLNLTGGSIHNIALNTAFLAAGRKVQVSMPLLLEAARTELRKLEKPVNEAELRWVEPLPDAGALK